MTKLLKTLSLYALIGISSLINREDRAEEAKPCYNLEFSAGEMTQFDPVVINNRKMPLAYTKFNMRLEKENNNSEFTFPIEVYYAKIKSHYDGVVDGYFGSFMTGANLVGRWTPFERDNFFSPYVQGHTGILYNDAYKNKYQNYLGSPLVFSLGLNVGMSMNISENLSLFLEYSAEHDSNAGLLDRNQGVNASGLLFGLTKRF